MFFTLQNIFHLLLQYKYFIIFPFAVLEGPIITIISGFLASLGQLNFWLAFAVLAFGDLVGDSLYYALGRFGRERLIAKYGKYLGLDQNRIVQIEKHFETHPWKTFTFGKVVHGTGSAILVAAGLGNVPYFEFLGYNIPTTMANTFILITLGYYFGHAYQRFNTYFEYVAVIGFALLIILYIYFIKRTKNSLD
jgi:membrane protein DedA with SNARE-associated domain